MEDPQTMGFNFNIYTYIYIQKWSIDRMTWMIWGYPILGHLNKTSSDV